MKTQASEPRKKVRGKQPASRDESFTRDRRREGTVADRTATLTILRRRPVRALMGLRKEWENDRPWRHAQATGFIVGEMVRNLQWTAHTFLPIVTRYIGRHGPYGVDGIWLSAVALTQRLNSSGFQDAIALADEISGTVNLPQQDAFGIYFFDLGMAIPSLSAPSFAGTTGLGNRTPGFRSSGLDGLSSGLGETRPVMMSAFPDSSRGPLFNDRGIGDAANVGGGFGVGVRATGRDALSAYSPQAQQSLYGDSGYLDKVWLCVGANYVNPDGTQKAERVDEPGAEIIGNWLTCAVSVYFDEPSNNTGDPAADATSARAAADAANANAADARAAADAADAKADESAADAANAAEANAVAEAYEADAAEAEAKAKAAEAKGTDEDPREAGVVEDPDEAGSQPADPGAGDGSGAGSQAIMAYRNLTPQTEPPPHEDLGGGNQMVHFPPDYFDEQIQTREGADSSSNAMELLARLRDLVPLINPTGRV